MYGEDPRDAGFAPRPQDEPGEARAKSDEEDAYAANRPRTVFFPEDPCEE